MISQNWHIRDRYNLLCVHHSVAGNQPVGVAILLPGFSHPMCDMDYFMSKLARKLSNENIFVVQVDLSGHGDSFGAFDEVNLKTIEEDILSLIAYYKFKFTGKLIFISRGLFATLSAKFCTDASVVGIAGVAPYCISPLLVRGFSLIPRAHSIDGHEIFKGDDYVHHSDFEQASLTLFSAFGAVPYNIHGMKFSQSLLDDLSDFDSLNALKNSFCKNKYWLFSDENDPSKLREFNFDTVSDYPENIYKHKGLRRDPKVQHQCISMLSAWATKTLIFN